MSGWIKLHRALINWEWYTDHNTCRLFIHCLLRANHSDTKWRGQKLNRGQFLTSLESLSNETGLSISQIRTSFKKLKSTDEIASLSQARSRIITVLKYDLYQSDDRLNDKLAAGSSQASDSEIATDKNVISKECKKEPKTLDHSPNDHLFEKFWSAGMRKVNKKKAKPLFSSLLKKAGPTYEEAFTERLYLDVKKRLEYNQLGFAEMHPTTYLNGERWNDEIKQNQVAIAANKTSFVEKHTSTGWREGL